MAQRPQPALEIDANMRVLCAALNAFQGVTTIGSCGGHEAPLTGGQWPSGSWYVKFRVRHDAAGWRALEFLAWLINNDAAKAGLKVMLLPTSPPPYLNVAGRVLTFALEGGGDDRDHLARWIERARKSVFVPVRAARRRACTLSPS